MFVRKQQYTANIEPHLSASASVDIIYAREGGGGGGGGIIMRVRKL